MTKLKITLGIMAVIATLALATSCTYAGQAHLRSIGANHKITVYSGGQAVRVWHSRGQVSSNEKSDGCYFQDASDGKLVEIQGPCVIEQE